LKLIGLAVNQAQAVTIDPDLSDAQRVEKLSGIACQAFKAMAQDNQLKERLRSILRSPGQGAPDLEALRYDMGALSALLRFERTELVAAGVKPEAVSAVLQAMSDVAKFENTRRLTYEEITDRILAARDGTCALQARFKAAEAQAKTTATVFQLEFLLIGGAVIVVDAFAVPTSAGLSVASIAVGGIMAGVGTPVLASP
jgi:hypothetical protein